MYFVQENCPLLLRKQAKAFRVFELESIHTVRLLWLQHQDPTIRGSLIGLIVCLSFLHPHNICVYILCLIPSVNSVQMSRLPRFNNFSAFFIVAAYIAETS